MLPAWGFKLINSRNESCEPHKLQLYAEKEKQNSETQKLNVYLFPQDKKPRKEIPTETVPFKMAEGNGRKMIRLRFRSDRQTFELQCSLFVQVSQ